MRKTTKRLLAVLVIGVASFFGGPRVIHQGYRFATGESEKLENKRRYGELANAEGSAKGNELLKIHTERIRLFHWFHARGWPIDEGDHEKSRSWRDLFAHWGAG